MWKKIENILKKDKKSLFRNYRYEKLNRWDYLVATLSAIVCLLFYVATLTPSISTGDNGELTVAAHYLGIAHSPSYPLHSLAGKISTFLPFSNVAWRVNFFSALCGSIFVFFSALSIVKCLHFFSFNLLEKYFAMFCVSVSLGLTQAVWSQATTAEVYTLSAIFFPIILLLLLKWHHHVLTHVQNTHPQKDYLGERYLLALALLFGHALGGHHTILMTEIFIIFFIYLTIVFHVLLPIGLKKSFTGFKHFFFVVFFYSLAWLLYYHYIMDYQADIYSYQYENLKKGLGIWGLINIGMILYYLYMRFFYKHHQPDNIMLRLSMLTVKGFMFIYLGFSIYLYLFIRSYGNPPINWGGINEQTTFWGKLAKFFFIIHRKQYLPNFLELNWDNFILLMRHTITPLISHQFSYPLWIMGAIGAFVLYRKSLFLFIVLFCGFVSYTLQLTLFLKFPLNNRAIVISEIFYIFSYLILSIPIAVGWAIVFTYLRKFLYVLFKVSFSTPHLLKKPEKYE